MISGLLAPTRPIFRLKGRVLDLARTALSRDATTSVVLKLGASILNLAMLTLLARAMSGHEFGVLALWLNILAFLAVVAGLGQERLILRSWSEYAGRGAWDLARGALRFGTVTAVAGAAAVAAAAALGGYWTTGDAGLSAAAAAFLMAQALFLYSAHVNRAAIGILGGDLHDMTWRILVIAAVSLALVSHHSLEARQFFIVAAVATAVSLALQVHALRSRAPAELSAARPRMELRAWSGRAFHMWTSANVEAASQYLEVIVIGVLLSPAAAGGYFVASRLANAFAMITGALHSFSTREIARQHHSAGPEAVSATLRQISLLTLVPAAIGLVAIVLGGHWILGIFGPSFVAEYPVLLVLSLGTAVLALAGPAASVLLLTGHERLYSGLLAANVALRFVLIGALASLYGSIGAAAASSLAAILTAVALTHACRRSAGLDPAVTMFLPRLRSRS